MKAAEYRIESSHPFGSYFSPLAASEQYLVKDRALAVALAAKSFTKPTGQEIRVVYVPTGEIVFRKAATASRPDASEDP